MTTETNIAQAGVNNIPEQKPFTRGKVEFLKPCTVIGCTLCLGHPLNHQITVERGRELRTLAADWRKRNYGFPQSGYVVVCEQTANGWGGDLGAMMGWLPGCVAVPFDESEGFFIAVGGDRVNGAERWERMTVISDQSGKSNQSEANGFHGLKPVMKPNPLAIVKVTEEERQSVIDGFIAVQRGIKTEQRAAVDLAVPALERLCTVLQGRSGQPKHLRGLMFSLYNGQPVSLLEALTLDWEIKKDFCALVLAFGYENGPVAICGPSEATTTVPDFFYAAMKEAITKAGQWEWFLEAFEEEDEQKEAKGTKGVRG